MKKYEHKDRSSDNLWLEGMNKFVHNKLAMIALIIFVFIILCCLLIPVLCDISPLEIDYDAVYARQFGPSRKHILGTDYLGRDLMMRLAWGGQTSLGIMASATLLAAIGGSLIGIASGFFGGNTDFFLMRFMDILASVPSLLLAAMLEAAFGFGKGHFMYGIALAAIPAYARIMRASVLSIMGSEYIEASRALGAGRIRIIGNHVLHNIAVPFIIQLLSTAADTLLTCTIMGYIQIGINPPTPEWGAIVHDTRDLIRSNSSVAVIPCATVVITAMCLNFIGNGLRDALDPRESGT